MKKGGLGIQTKISLSFVLLIFFVVTGVFGYNVYELLKEKRQGENERQNLFVSSQSAKALDLLITEDEKILTALATDIADASPDVVFSMFRDGQSRIIAHSFQGEVPAELKPVGRDGREGAVLVKLGNQETIRVITSPVESYGTITLGFKQVELLSLLEKGLADYALIYVVSLLAGFLVSLMIARRIVRPLRALYEGVVSAGKGELVEVPVTSSDEIGLIAEGFNETMGKLQAYIQTDDERQNTQQNVMAFLEVVSQASEGDLSLKAPVTADVFGNIADAYNVMVDSLADLLTNVRKSANEVGDESRRLLDIFKTLEQGSESQMTQVKQVTTAIDETAASTQDIVMQVEGAREAASTMGSVAERGRELVSHNTDGMQKIRVTVQAINKKMKNLSERLLEIGSISNLISDVSSRTTILATNAAIVAARAGAQGKGFMVIADEIKELADRTTEATKQIGTTVKAIQSEASEVTGSLEEETKIVENQARLANDTGDAFREIEEAIATSRNTVGEIYDQSQSQRKLTNNVVLSVEEVSKISMKALSLVKHSASISEGLYTTSSGLLSSLQPFRLPTPVTDEGAEEDDAYLEGRDLAGSYAEPDSQGERV